MQLAQYLGFLERAQVDLHDGFLLVAERHADEADVTQLCRTMAQECDRHARRLGPALERYGEDADREPDRLTKDLFAPGRTGGLGLIRDLQDLHVLAGACDIAWTLVGQAAQGARDRELLATVHECEGETARQLQWLRGRMKEAAPQALVVA